MKKKILSLVLAVVMIAAVLGGCGTKKDEGPKKVTALFFSLEGEYFTILDTLLKDGITSKGYEYESQSSNFDPVTMIEQIENAVASGTDALWVWSTNAAAVADACRAAKEKGVIVYCFAQDPGEDARDVFRGTDQTFVGKSIAKMGMAWADEVYGKDAPAGSIKTIVYGNPTGEEDRIRFESIQAEIANDPRFEVLEAVGVTNTVEAQSATENMFGKYGNIDCFLCGGGEMALGVAAYVTSESSPITDFTQFGAFGSEINGETAAYMQQGIIKGLVINGGLIQDNIAVQVDHLDKLLKGEAVDPISMVEIGEVTAANLADYGY